MGDRLKQLRIAAGLEIKEVALRTGKTYQYIWKIEEGINEPPTWELLAKFSELYKCSVDSLLGLEGEELQRLTLPVIAPERANASAHRGQQHSGIRQLSLCWLIRDCVPLNCATCNIEIMSRIAGESLSGMARATKSVPSM